MEEKILRTELKDLNLSVRTMNCLNAAEIKTVGELIEYSKERLLNLLNFGQKSINELEEYLDSVNLDLLPGISKKVKQKKESILLKQLQLNNQLQEKFVITTGRVLAQLEIQSNQLDQIITLLEIMELKLRKI